MRSAWEEERAIRNRRSVQGVRPLVRAIVDGLQVGEFTYSGAASGIAVRVRRQRGCRRTFLHWCVTNNVFAEEMTDCDVVLWVPVGGEGVLAEASVHAAVDSAHLLTNVRPPRAAGAGEFRHGMRKPHPIHGFSGPGRAERQAEAERERRAALPQAARTAVEGRDEREYRLARLAHLASRIGPPSLADEAEIGRLMAECGLV